MAEGISDAAAVWHWAIKYLASLEQFDGSLLEELIEATPVDVIKSAKKILQSPLPAKSTLELLKEKILGGFISDEYSKRWSGVVADSVESDSVRPMEEEEEEEINQQPSTSDADDQPLESDSIEDDSSSDDDDDGYDDGDVLVGTSGANASVEVQNDRVHQQPATAETGDCVKTGGASCDGSVRLEGEKSVGDDNSDDGVQNVNKNPSGGNKPIGDNQNGSISTKTSNAQSNDDVQNSKQQPSGAVVENSVVNQKSTGDDHVQKVNKQASGALVEKVKSGGKPTGDIQNGSISMTTSNAQSDDVVQNSKQQPSGDVAENSVVNGDGKLNDQEKVDGNKTIENSHGGSLINVKASDVRAKVNRPFKTADKNCEQVKSGGNKLIEKNHNVSISMRSSNNARSNGVVQNHQQLPGAAVLEHPLVSGDGNLNKLVKADGKKPIGNNHSGSASVKNSDNNKQPSGAEVDRPLKNGDKNLEQVKSGGNKLIEQNRDDSISMKSSNDDNDVQKQKHQLSPGPVVEEHHPSVNDNGNATNKQVNSDGNRPINTSVLVSSTSVKTLAGKNQEQIHQQSLSHMETDNEQEKERANRKRKMNDFLEGQQQPMVPGLEGPPELNLCVKCHQTGAVLVCGTVGCPMMLHKHCLGFNVDGEEGEESFYCPLCSYSRAVAEFREAQRRVALTRKDLTMFVVGMQL